MDINPDSFLYTFLLPSLREMDIPHGPMHSIDLNNMVRFTCRSLGIDYFDEIVLETSAIFHDMGLAITQTEGSREHHPRMSVEISNYFALEPDIPLNEIILFHDRDILEPDTERPIRIFRDLDRIARTGYIGIAMMSYYLEFRHDLISDGFALRVDREFNFYDPPNPTESPIAWSNVVYESLTPYLIKNGLLHEMISLIELYLRRIDGSLNLETGEVLIEPIMTELADLWRDRIDESRLYLQELKIIAQSNY